MRGGEILHPPGRNRVKRKNPMTLKDIRLVYELFEGEKMSFTHLRTLTMLLLGFSGFLRYDELSHIIH